MKNALAARKVENPKSSAKIVMNPSKIVNIKRVNIPAWPARIEELWTKMKNALTTKIGENPKLVTHVIAVKTVVKPSARSTMNPSKIVTVKRVNIPA